ncbi:hypothetical protein DBR06_SOUSAS6710028 [Sousa chinensis]|uniref:Uncharacterized protein n=1 Tax=Sousa chinensis TaxID=103600 RepID=A0A484GNG7_SOUCH|nr:hypothetical protein DBR06_SOUSAS6710028 [Sousa chinensis]|eukprot:bmy_04045T0
MPRGHQAADAGCGGPGSGEEGQGDRSSPPCRNATRAANQEKKRLFLVSDLWTRWKGKEKDLVSDEKKKKIWKRGP